MANGKDAELSQDDDFNFEDFDLSALDQMENFDYPHEADNDGSLSDGIIPLLEGFVDDIASESMMREVVRKVLPPSYGNLIDVYDEVKDTSTEVFNKASRIYQSQSSQMRMMSERAISMALKYKLPDTVKTRLTDIQKSIREQMEAEAAERAASAGYHESEEERETNQINATLAQIFEAQTLENQARDKREETREEIQNEIEHKRFATTTGILKDIHTNVASLQAYQNTIGINFQRKSLELQLRQYRTQVKSLDELKRMNLNIKAELEGIRFNTAMPDALRMSLSKEAQAKWQNAFKDKMGSALFGRESFLAKFVQKNKTWANQRIQELSETMDMSLGSLQGTLEMASSMGIDINPLELAAQYGMNALLGKGLNMVGDSMKGRGSIERFGNRVDMGMSNLEVLGRDWALKNQNQALKLDAYKDVSGKLNYSRLLADLAGLNMDEAEKKTFLQQLSDLSSNGGTMAGNVFSRVLKPLLGKSLLNSTETNLELQGDKLGDWRQPGMLTKQSVKTINEIIPGYLARILREINVFRTGNENAPMTMFNPTTNKFETQTEIMEDIGNSVLSRGVLNRRESNLRGLIDRFDTNKDLTPEEREIIGEYLIKTALDRERLMDEDFFRTMTDHGEAALGTQLARKFNLMTNRLMDSDENTTGNVAIEINRKIRDIRDQVADPSFLTQEWVDAGYGEILEQMGLIRRDEFNKTHTNNKTLFDWFAKGKHGYSGEYVVPGTKEILVPGMGRVNRSRLRPSGFSDGGYTGDGDVDEVSGVTHKQEFVFDAESVKRLGKDNLERLRKYAKGKTDEVTSSKHYKLLQDKVDDKVSKGKNLYRNKRTQFSNYLDTDEGNLAIALNRIADVVEDITTNETVMDYRDKARNRYNLLRNYDYRTNAKTRYEAMRNFDYKGYDYKGTLRNRAAQLKNAASDKSEELRYQLWLAQHASGDTVNELKVKAGEVATSIKDKVSDYTPEVLKDKSKDAWKGLQWLYGHAMPENFKDNINFGTFNQVYRNIASSTYGGALNMFGIHGKPREFLEKYGHKAGRALNPLNIIETETFQKYGTQWLGEDRMKRIGAQVYKTKERLGDIVDEKGAIIAKVRDLKEGKLFNEDGSVIKKWEEIKGHVYDADGNIAISAEEIKDALVKVATDAGTNIVNLKDKVNIQAATTSITNKVDDVKEIINKVNTEENRARAKRGIGYLAGKIGFKASTPQDVYVAGETEPRLTAKGMWKGLYTNVPSGKPVYTVSDIEGTVVDAEGNTLLTTEDIQKGLVDKRGKPFDKAMFKGLGKSIGDIASAVKKFREEGVNFKTVSYALRQSWKIQGRMIVAPIKIGWSMFKWTGKKIINFLFRRKKNKVSEESAPEIAPESIIAQTQESDGSINQDKAQAASLGMSVVMNNTLRKILTTLKFSEESRQQDAADAAEQAEEAQRAAEKKAHEDAKLARKDADGDGDIEGSVKDLRQKQALEKEKREALEKEKKEKKEKSLMNRMEDFSKGYFGILGSILGGMKDLALGLGGGIASLLGLKKLKGKITGGFGQATSKLFSGGSKFLGLLKGKGGKLGILAAIIALLFSGEDAIADTTAGISDTLTGKQPELPANQPTFQNQMVRDPHTGEVMPVMQPTGSDGGFWSTVVGGLTGATGLGAMGLGAMVAKNKGAINGVKYVKGVPVLGTALTLGLGAYQGYNAYKQNDFKGVTEAATGTLGSLSGMLGGMAAGAMVGGPIGAIIGGIGGAIMGEKAGAKIGGWAYAAGRKFTRASMNDVNTARIAQYGFVADSDEAKTMLDLEDMLMPFVQEVRGSYSIGKGFNEERVMEMFNIDINDKEALARFNQWYQVRFRQNFINWIRAVKKVKPDSKHIEDADYLKNEQLTQIMNDVIRSADQYPEVGSPFNAVMPTPVNGQDVMDILNKLFTEAKDDSRSEKKDIGGIVWNAGKKALKALVNPLGAVKDTISNIKVKLGMKTEEEAAADKAKEEAESKDEYSFWEKYKYGLKGNPLTMHYRWYQAFFGDAGKVDPLTAIRLKAYGLRELDTSKTRQLLDLEDEVIRNQLKYSGDTVEYSGSIGLLAQKWISTFSSKPYLKIMLRWLEMRFLPVLIAFVSEANRLAKNPANIHEAVQKLHPSKKVVIADAMIQARSARGTSIWSLVQGPWPDYPLATSSTVTDANYQTLKSEMKGAPLAEETKDGAKNEKIKDDEEKAKTLLDRVKDGFSSFKDSVSSFWDKTKEAAKETVENVASAATGTANAVVDGYQEAKESVSDAVQGVITGDTSVKEGLTKAVTGVGTSVANTVGKVTGAVSGSQKQIALSVYKAFRNAGFSDRQARILTAEVGRENGLQKRYLFGYHKDPHKGVNLGMISWQRDRGIALEKFMKERGLLTANGIVESQEALNAQAIFLRKEMESGTYKYMKQFMATPNIDEKTGLDLVGRHFIKWRIDDPKYYAAGVRNRNHFLGVINSALGSNPEATKDPAKANDNKAAPVTGGVTGSKSAARQGGKLPPANGKEDSPAKPGVDTPSSVAKVHNELTQKASPRKEADISAGRMSQTQGIENKGKRSILAGAGPLNQGTLQANSKALVGSNHKAVKAAAIATRRAHAKSIGRCAQYVREALEMAGFKGVVRGHAYQWLDGRLQKLGFVVIPNNAPSQVGDIKVFDRVPSAGANWGHIEIFNGTIWVSCFRQRTAYVRTIYRTSRHVTYRHTDLLKGDFKALENNDYEVETQDKAGQDTGGGSAPAPATANAAAQAAANAPQANANPAQATGVDAAAAGGQRPPSDADRTREAAARKAQGLGNNQNDYSQYINPQQNKGPQVGGTVAGFNLNDITNNSHIVNRNNQMQQQMLRDNAQMQQANQTKSLESAVNILTESLNVQKSQLKVLEELHKAIANGVLAKPSAPEAPASTKPTPTNNVKPDQPKPTQRGVPLEVKSSL